MEGECEIQQQQPPPTACVSKVLDDDDLLTEILVRVGFPTSLVRAAAVCRRWLGLASDRAFLRRFRELHPPRLLGFYLAHRDGLHAPAYFFPVLPQPLELTAVVRRAASFRLDPYDYEGAPTDVAGCWNGTVLTSTTLRPSNIFQPQELVFQVHTPLCPSSNSKRGMATIPALRIPFPNSNVCNYSQLFSKEEEDGAVCYFYVTVVGSVLLGESSVLQVNILRDGDDAWRTHLTLTFGGFLRAPSRSNSVLVDNKIYIPSVVGAIFVLDLTAQSYSTIWMPQGVRNCGAGTIMLSQAHDASGLYLIHAKEFQLHIWLHKGGNWSLVDTICLREMCADLLEDEPTALLYLNHVGDYTAEFLFLEMGRFALYLDVKRRTLHKVYEMTQEDRCFGRIYPFTMIWPPIFPALKDAPASNHVKNKDTRKLSRWYSLCSIM